MATGIYQILKVNASVGMGEECPFFFGRVCVRKVSQVDAEEAGIELQVVIMERLGTAAKLAVHLAQVSQVDQVR